MYKRQVLRYLVRTHDAGLRFPRAGRESHLQCWTDAGYGGEGTKGQSGVLVAWAGAVILWRSSKQSTISLSTCECEVGAAALGFQIVEGLRSLIVEWGVRLDPPALYQDNQSAMTVIQTGGTWRTRYFATRAARLSEEHKLKSIVLHYCPTKLMAADGLTKLSTAEMHQNMREAMQGRLPSVEGEATPMKVEDQTWWAHAVLQRPLRRRLESSNNVNHKLLRSYAASHPWLPSGLHGHRVPEHRLLLSLIHI